MWSNGGELVLDVTTGITHVVRSNGWSRHREMRKMPVRKRSPP